MADLINELDLSRSAARSLPELIRGRIELMQTDGVGRGPPANFELCPRREDGPHALDDIGFERELRGALQSAEPCRERLLVLYQWPEMTGRLLSVLLAEARAMRQSEDARMLAFIEGEASQYGVPTYWLKLLRDSGLAARCYMPYGMNHIEGVADAMRREARRRRITGIDVRDRALALPPRRRRSAGASTDSAKAGPLPDLSARGEGVGFLRNLATRAIRARQAALMRPSLRDPTGLPPEAKRWLSNVVGAVISDPGDRLAILELWTHQVSNPGIPWRAATVEIAARFGIQAEHLLELHALVRRYDQAASELHADAAGAGGESLDLLAQDVAEKFELDPLHILAVYRAIRRPQAEEGGPTEPPSEDK